LADRTGPAAHEAPVAPRHRGAVRGVSYGALFVIGGYTGLLGPVLPELARRTGTTLGDAGALFSALFAGSLISTLAAGRALDRVDRRLPLAAGLAVNGAALLAMPWVTTWPALLAAGVVLGLGDGATVVGTHVVVAHINPDAEAAALNRLNVLFGMGAVLGPAGAAAVAAGGARGSLLLAALGAAQVAFAALLLARAAPLGHPVSAPLPAGADREPTGSLRASRLLWLLSGLLLIYVGIEVGLGGWAFTYARESAGLSAAAAALLSGGFWGTLTFGRLLAPVALRYRPPVALLIGGPVIAAAGAAVLLIAGGVPAVLVAGVLITGMGFGPVWPVTFAIAARAFPHASGSVSGILAMLAALGGLGLPWLQGRVLVAGGPAAGITVTLAGCLALVALALAVRSRLPLTASQAAPP
jgi:fucose permease